MGKRILSIVIAMLLLITSVPVSLAEELVALVSTVDATETNTAEPVANTTAETQAAESAPVVEPANDPVVENTTPVVTVAPTKSAQEPTKAPDPVFPPVEKAAPVVAKVQTNGYATIKAKTILYSAKDKAKDFAAVEENGIAYVNARVESKDGNSAKDWLEIYFLQIEGDTKNIKKAFVFAEDAIFVKEGDVAGLKANLAKSFDTYMDTKKEISLSVL
ncbi:MAG: hypothetical protein GYA87_10350 [Christensenellaceae bacterium]|nr:hypothetical protein [Christensenellaceae bacterium]